MSVFRETPGGGEEGIDAVPSPFGFGWGHEIAIGDDVLHPAVGGIQNLRNLGAGVALIEEAEDVMLEFQRERRSDHHARSGGGMSLRIPLRRTK